MPLEMPQFRKLVKSYWSNSASAVLLIHLNIFASSANRRIFEYLIEKTISLVNKLNSNGERWSHCGTPDNTKIGLEIQFLYFNFTNWILLVENEFNHDKRGSVKPIILSLCIKSSWLILSKAFSKSVYITSVCW